MNRATLLAMAVLISSIVALAPDVQAQAPGKGSSPPSSSVKKKVDPVVGKWRWFNGTVVTILADGTFSNNKGLKGTWVVFGDDSARKYVLNWGRKGKWVDTLTLKQYDRELSGQNKAGDKVFGTRIEEK